MLNNPFGQRIDAIEALDRVSFNPARRRAQQTNVQHARVSADAWTKPTTSGGNASLQPESPTSRVPRVSQPLRVEPPPEYNAPARAQRLQRSGSRHSTEQVRQHRRRASCAGIATSSPVTRTALQVLSSKLARRPLLGAPTAKARPEKMKDYSVLAAACQRAGRQTRAAHLTFNQGVLFENMGEDDEALRCYKVSVRVKA